MEALGRLSVEGFKDAKKLPLVVVLDNVRSMHNVGSVFRTADAFLVESIFLCGFTPQPPHREINKTALGSTETVNWQYFTSAQEAIDTLILDGFKIVAVEQVKQSRPLQEFNWNGHDKVALVFGNEVEGVQQGILNRSHDCLEIPQLGSKHSLNISVAAGMVLWEMVRAVVK